MIRYEHNENVLFLIHVEEMFRDMFPDKMYVNRLIKACTCRKYHEIYICISGVAEYKPIHELTQVTNQSQWIDWSWGYEPEQFDHDKDELSWLIPALGHEYTWIPPELRDNQFNSANVFVGGGSESECLQDWCDCLDHCDIDFEKVHGYIF